MQDLSKVYVIYNSNEEGFNLVGIYNSKSKAEEICKKINDGLVKEATETVRRMREKGDPLYDGDSLIRQARDWDGCDVTAFRMDEVRSFYHEFL